MTFWNSGSKFCLLKSVFRHPHPIEDCTRICDFPIHQHLVPPIIVDQVNSVLSRRFVDLVTAKFGESEKSAKKAERDR